MAALAVCCIAFFVSGCGDDTSSSAPSADSAEATSETTAPKPTEKDADKKAKKSDSKKSSSAKADDEISAYNNPTVETTAEDQSVMPGEQKVAVRKAFNKNIDALRNGDVDYLCNEAYSKEFVQLLEQKGGCVSATTKQVEGITSYSSKITSIARYPNSNLIVVYADFNFKNATGAHKSKGGIYFKTQNGQWKRAIPPK